MDAHLKKDGIPVIAAAIALAALAVLVGCSGKSKAKAYAARADGYFEEGKYDEASIEYRNLLRLDPKNVRALTRLGVISCEQGSTMRGVPFLRGACKVAPDAPEPRLRLALALQSLGQDAAAHAEAITLLDASSSDGEALLLAAESARSPEEIAAVEKRLAAWQERDTVAWHLAAASIALRRGDREGALKEAERALELDPQSLPARLAMANLCAARQDLAAAEEHSRIAAANAPPRSSAHLRYAGVKLLRGGREEAVSMLLALIDKVPDYLPARILLGRIELEAGNFKQALVHIESVLARDATHHDALLLQAKALTGRGDGEEALRVLARLDASYPDMPVSHYESARAHLREGDAGRAANALQRALDLKPEYADATLLLAQVNLRLGKTAEVIRAMEAFLGKNPADVRAQVFLAEAYRHAGRLDDAAAVFRAQVAAQPDSYEPHYRLGTILRQQGRLEEARTTLEKAAAIAPDQIFPVYDLVQIDLAGKDFAGAHATVTEFLSRAPESAPAHSLRGRLFLMEQKWDEAEAALKRTIELDDTFPFAYSDLISVYVRSNRLAEAAQELEAVLEANPTDGKALMLSAIIRERLGERSDARTAYEKLLEIDPDNTIALNNLACLLLENPDELERALALASRAHTLRPDDPAMSDTLGWVHFRRGDYPQALSLLRECAPRIADNPEVSFHLGMAHYMMGQAEEARKHLQEAGHAPADFAGKEEARRRLAFLADGAEGAEEGAARPTVEDLEKMLDAQPDDVLARMRLGAAHEAGGDFAAAAEAYTQALAVNPGLLAAVTRMASLHAGPLDDLEKALDYARRARELAPEDPAVLAQLGRIVYESGNFSWAHSLLQESATRGVADAGVLYDCGRAAYAQGMLPAARAAMQRLLDEAPSAPEARDAEVFLSLVALVESRNASAEAQRAVADVLARDPRHAPALLVRACMREREGDIGAAIEDCREVLGYYPACAPAQKYLAILYARDAANQERAYEAGMKARETLRDDPELARMLALISHRKDDHAQAVRLLEECERGGSLDPEARAYLGLSQWQLGRKAEGAAAMEAGLEAGLAEPLRSIVQKALAESE